MGPARFTALDGLRGMAALIVVVHHALLTSPTLAQAYDGTPGEQDQGGWWLIHTPLHLAWDGTAAVYVFFILSGFVLTVPLLRWRAGRWRSYYPQRLARLYLPVWGAVVFAALLIVLFPRVERPGQSWWVVQHASPALDARTLLGDLTLLNPSKNDSPLWSLAFEVGFSVLLPIYFLVARRLSPWALLLGLGAVVTTGIGAGTGTIWLVYPPMFAVGVLMAVRQDELRRLADRTPAWAWGALLMLAAVLVSARWMFLPVGLGTAVAVVGAALVVYAFLGCSTAVKVGGSRAAQWLGALSFSLYLVHEPIVVTTDFLWPRLAPWAVLLVALPVALLVATGFRLMIEAPAHRFAKALGRRFAARPRREPATDDGRAPEPGATLLPAPPLPGPAQATPPA